MVFTGETTQVSKLKSFTIKRNRCGIGTYHLCLNFGCTLLVSPVCFALLSSLSVFSLANGQALLIEMQSHRESEGFLTGRRESTG